ELLDGVMNILTRTTNFPVLTDSVKQFHLGTVENARAYIFENFTQDISLQQLAEHCLVSPFHFSRIFKTVMNISPHQYLREVRLNHAKILLMTTGQSITDVALACGFNSLEHFVTAYRQRFKINPSAQRKLPV
ncbi:MAG: helix-turn-helix transcriptional regulator, partial [Bacteroidetes bacterium]